MRHLRNPVGRAGGLEACVPWAFYKCFGALLGQVTWCKIQENPACPLAGAGTAPPFWNQLLLSYSRLMPGLTGVRLVCSGMWQHFRSLCFLLGSWNQVWFCEERESLGPLEHEGYLLGVDALAHSSTN